MLTGKKGVSRLLLIHILLQSTTIVFCFTSCSTNPHRCKTSLSIYNRNSYEGSLQSSPSRHSYSVLEMRDVGRDRGMIGRRQRPQQQYPDAPLKGFMLQKEAQTEQQQAYRRQPNTFGAPNQSTGRTFSNSGSINTPRESESHTLLGKNHLNKKRREDLSLSVTSGNRHVDSYFPPMNNNEYFEHRHRRDFGDVDNKRRLNQGTIENKRFNNMKQPTNVRQNDRLPKIDNRSGWSNDATARRQGQNFDNARLNNKQMHDPYSEQKPRSHTNPYLQQKRAYNSYSDVLRRMDNNVFLRQNQPQHERDTNVMDPYLQQKQTRKNIIDMENQQKRNTNIFSRQSQQQHERATNNPYLHQKQRSHYHINDEHRMENQQNRNKNFSHQSQQQQHQRANNGRTNNYNPYLQQKQRRQNINDDSMQSHQKRTNNAMNPTQRAFNFDGGKDIHKDNNMSKGRRTSNNAHTYNTHSTMNTRSKEHQRATKDGVNTPTLRDHAYLQKKQRRYNDNRSMENQPKRNNNASMNPLVRTFDFDEREDLYKNTIPNSRRSNNAPANDINTYSKVNVRSKQHQRATNHGTSAHPSLKQKQRSHNDEYSMENRQTRNNNAVNPMQRTFDFDGKNDLNQNNISNRRRTMNNNARTHDTSTYSSMNTRSSNAHNRRNEESVPSRFNNAQSSRHKRRDITNAWARNNIVFSNKINPQSSSNDRQNGKESISSSQYNKQSNNNLQRNMVVQDYIANIRSRMYNKTIDNYSQVQESNSDYGQHNNTKQEITGYNINMKKLKLLMKNSVVDLDELDLDSMRSIVEKCMEETIAMMEEGEIDDEEECWE